MPVRVGLPALEQGCWNRAGISPASTAGSGECFVDQGVNLVLVGILNARSDLRGLSHNLLPQNLAFVGSRRGMRPISVNADGLIVGQSTAQPPLDKQPFVAGQVPRLVDRMVRHRATPSPE